MVSSCLRHLALRALGLSLTLFYSIQILVVLAFYKATHPFSKLHKDRPAPPPCLFDSKHGVHKYARINGIKLHYVEKGDPSKPLIIFVHGFPEFWYSWRHQIADLHKDYWCVAFDMRGFGDSEKPNGTKPYVLQYLIDDIKELILSLGRQKCTIIGHDWGAIVTWKFAETYGEMVDSFITINAPSIDAYVKTLWMDWKQILRSWYVFMFQAPFLAEWLIQMNDLAAFSRMKLDDKNITKQDIEAYKYTFGKAGALTPCVNYYRANFTLEGKNVKERIKMPRGLYSLSENDDYISHKSINATIQMYENVKTIKVLKTTHFMPEEDPDRTNEIIREFLNQPSS